jgi:hypothetical protein
LSKFFLPEFLQSLILGAPDKEEICLCPKLRVVQLSFDYGFNLGALSAFIRSRRNIETVHDRAVRLKCIQLTTAPGISLWEPEIELRDLKEFQYDGLDILVHCQDGGWREVIL